MDYDTVSLLVTFNSVLRYNCHYVLKAFISHKDKILLAVGYKIVENFSFFYCNRTIVLYLVMKGYIHIISKT